ncbi:MAG: hypothetical protein M3P10_11390, partial [Actinomycetota bacterium]|nr:hypothetical protein [Actinomycetota bacterium]
RNPAPAGRRMGPGAEQPPPEPGSGSPVGPVKVERDGFSGEAAPASPRRGPAADPDPPHG